MPAQASTHFTASRTVINRATLCGAMLMAATVSLLKGLAWPHPWGASHTLFNYEAGFVKRGFFGAVQLAVFPELFNRYLVFAAFALTVLAAVSFLLLRKLWVLARREEPELAMVGVVYASSIGLAVLADTAGYFDHLALLGVLLIISVRAFWTRWLAVTLFFVLMILTHEASFVMALPLCVCSLWLDSRNQTTALRRAAIATSVIALAVLTYVVAHAVVPSRSAQQLFEQRRTEVDYALFRPAFNVLAASGSDGLTRMLRSFKSPKALGDLSYAIIATLPCLAYLVWSAHRLLKRSRACWHERLVLFGAGLAPLAMPLVGWDLFRWTAMATTTMTIAIVVVASREPRAAPAPADVASAASEPGAAIKPIVMPMAALAVALLGMATGGRTVHGHDLQPAPFYGHARSLLVSPRRFFNPYARRPDAVKAWPKLRPTRAQLRRQLLRPAAVH